MKSLSFAMLLVGTIIGAGFATGREILSFFGNSGISYFVVPICGIGVFACSVMFLLIGKKTKASDIATVNSRLLGKLHMAADIFLLFNSFVVLAGMLAAMDSLFGIVLPIAPAYSIISGILCAIIVAKGLKGLLGGNLVIVPVLIVSIILICSFAIVPNAPIYPLKWLNLPAAAIYVSMNMMLACTVFTTIKSLTTKQILVSSAIAALAISVLLAAIIAALNSSGQQGEMPLIQIALGKSKVLFYVSLAAVATSIFTTMMTAMSGLSSWLNTLIGDTRYSVILVLIAGLILSNLGFENVVSFLYPVIGIVGILYIAVCIVFLVRTRKLVNAGEVVLQNPLPKSTQKQSHKLQKKLPF